MLFKDLKEGKFFILPEDCNQDQVEVYRKIARQDPMGDNKPITAMTEKMERTEAIEDDRKIIALIL